MNSMATLTPQSQNDRFVAIAHEAKQFPISRRFAWLILINASLMVAIAGGVYTFYHAKHSQNSERNGPMASAVASANPQANKQAQLPVLDANSNTANRYFAGESNALDFRKDGSKGAFSMNVEKNGNNVTVKWDQNMQVSSVMVYDLGRLDNLTDSKLVFGVSYGDTPTPFPSGTPLILNAKMASPMPTPTIVVPTVFLPNPYRLGEIPSNYHRLGLPEEGKSLLTKGARYSIEATAWNQNGGQKIASYTFTE